MFIQTFIYNPEYTGKILPTYSETLCISGSFIWFFKNYPNLVCSKKVKKRPNVGLHRPRVCGNNIQGVKIDTFNTFRTNCFMTNLKIKAHFPHFF